MYCTDFITGETLFQFPDSGSPRQVFLEAFADGKRLRIRMQRRTRDWIARIKLPAGWCFYCFDVDGKVRWDRDTGKMKTQDGRACSLALISNNATISKRR